MIHPIRSKKFIFVEILLGVIVVAIVVGIYLFNSQISKTGSPIAENATTTIAGKFSCSPYAQAVFDFVKEKVDEDKLDAIDEKKVYTSGPVTYTYKNLDPKYRSETYLPLITKITPENKTGVAYLNNEIEKVGKDMMCYQFADSVEPDELSNSAEIILLYRVMEELPFAKVMADAEKQAIVKCIIASADQEELNIIASYGLSFEGQTEITHADQNLISFRVNASYECGWVHPGYFSSDYIFDIKKQKRLRFLDLLNKFESKSTDGGISMDEKERWNFLTKIFAKEMNDAKLLGDGCAESYTEDGIPSQGFAPSVGIEKEGVRIKVDFPYAFRGCELSKVVPVASLAEYFDNASPLNLLKK